MDNLKHERFTYGDHERQRISVWTTDKSGYWVMYELLGCEEPIHNFQLTIVASQWHFF